MAAFEVDRVGAACAAVQEGAREAAVHAAVAEAVGEGFANVDGQAKWSAIHTPFCQSYQSDDEDQLWLLERQLLLFVSYTTF